MTDWTTCEAIEQNPEYVSSAWVFRGARIPVSSLFENIEDDINSSQLVEWFPGITTEQVQQVLEHVTQSTIIQKQPAKRS